MSVCLCLSQVGVIEMDERIELVWGMGAFFHLSYTVFYGNSGNSKIMVLPSGTLSQTVDLENIARHIGRRNVLSTELDNVDAQSVINWAVVGQLS